MSIWLSVLLFATPGVSLEGLLKTHGWGTVSVDEQLTKASIELARRVGRSRKGREPKALGKTVQFLLAKHHLSDANVTPFIIHHDKKVKADDQLVTVLARLERRMPPTHYGLGQYKSTQQTTTVILLVHRGVELRSPLPRHLKSGRKLTIHGRLRRGYFRPRVIVASPGGHPIDERPAWTGQRSVDAEVHLTSGPGAYGIEIVADSQYGPVVLNNHVIYLGVPIPRLPVVRLNSPNPPTASLTERQRLMSAVNQLRVRHGLSTLQEEPRLAKAALEHATEMARRKTVSHTSPHTGNLVMRLRKLGLEPIAVAENLAEASDALAALRAFQESPGHARNLVLPGMTHVGIGVVGRYFAITFAQLNIRSKRAPFINPLGTTKSP